MRLLQPFALYDFPGRANHMNLQEPCLRSILFEISNWGGERFPIRFQTEPEFGLSGYKGILNKELTLLDRMINEEGVGKDGEVYANLVLDPPEVRLVEEIQAMRGQAACRLQWEQRYAKGKKLTFIRRVLLSRYVQAIFWKRLFYRVKRLFPISKKKRKAYSGLAPVFRGAEHFLCLTETFWLDNKKFVMDFFPLKSRTVISALEASVELQESLRVPLIRLNTNSLEGWAVCQNIHGAPGCLIVVDGHHLEKTIKILHGKLGPKQRVLVTSEFSDTEMTDEWGSATQVGEKLWLLEGPPPSLLRCAESFAEPAGGWPRISVIIVSYNQADFIRDCLDSVLDQGYPNAEFIVVDGHSTDGSIEILESYRDRMTHLIIEPDECQSDALNKGFKLATGDVMTWVCSDDLLEPGSLFHVGRTYAETNVDVIAGGCRIINASGDNLSNHHNGCPFGEPVSLSFGDLLSFLGVWELGMYFYQPEVFFSRRIWEASGGYIKEHLHFAMDYDLFLRFAMAGAKMLHIPEYLALRRLHESQKTQHETMSYLPTIRNLLEEYHRLIEKLNRVTA